MELRETRVEEFENQLQQLRVQDAEEYNMVKIKLEKDVQVQILIDPRIIIFTKLIHCEIFIFEIGKILEISRKQ